MTGFSEEVKFQLKLAVGRMWTYFVPMKTATVRELRNEFSKLEAWLGEGEEIQIEKRGKVVGVLKPAVETKSSDVIWPDFTARRKTIWGDRVFSEKEVWAMREAELEGEEG